MQPPKRRLVKTALLYYLLAIVAMNVVPVSWLLACAWIALRDRARWSPQRG